MKLAFNKSAAITVGKSVGIGALVAAFVYTGIGVFVNQLDRYYAQNLHYLNGHAPYGWQTWFEYEPTAEDIKHAEKPAEKDDKKAALYPELHR